MVSSCAAFLTLEWGSGGGGCLPRGSWAGYLVAAQGGKRGRAHLMPFFTRLSLGGRDVATSWPPDGQ